MVPACRGIRNLVRLQELDVELDLAKGTSKCNCRLCWKQRRWSALEFRQFFVLHPLLRHLVRRLLWARWDGPQPQCFRVAEDLSYADAHDALYLLPDEAQVGIVHPLELSPADAAAFGQLFADYEILQPFAQLGREIWRLSEDEQQSFELER